MNQCCQRMLPEGAVFAWSSPCFNESTAPEPMRRHHLAPKGKCGLLNVRKGSLFIVWEDTRERVRVTSEKPQLIGPERPHYLEFEGPVEFQVDFFSLPEKSCCQEKKTACGCAGGANLPRPGEAFKPQK